MKPAHPSRYPHPNGKNKTSPYPVGRRDPTRRNQGEGWCFRARAPRPTLPPRQNEIQRKIDLRKVLLKCHNSERGLHPATLHNKQSVRACRYPLSYVQSQDLRSGGCPARYDNATCLPLSGILKPSKMERPQGKASRRHLRGAVVRAFSPTVRGNFIPLNRGNRRSQDRSADLR